MKHYDFLEKVLIHRIYLMFVKANERVRMDINGDLLARCGENKYSIQSHKLDSVGALPTAATIRPVQQI